MSSMLNKKKIHKIKGLEAYSNPFTILIDKVYTVNLLKIIKYNLQIFFNKNVHDKKRLDYPNLM